MKRGSLYTIFLCIPILLLGFFVVSQWAFGISVFVQIREIYYDAPGSDTGKEWIEIENISSVPVDMNGWKFFEEDTKHSLSVERGDFVLDSWEVAILADNAKDFIVQHPDVQTTVFDSSFSLRNDTKNPEPLAFVDKDGNQFSSTDYVEFIGFGKEGYSLELCSGGKWKRSALSGGSPGQDNCGIVEFPKTLLLSEVLPDPKEISDSEREFVEVYNFGATAVDLAGWKIADKTGEKSLTGTVAPEAYKALYKTVSLNDADEMISLIAPDGEKADSAEYGNSQDGWSYARDEKVWKWTPIVTPDEKNKFPEGASGSAVRLSELLPNPAGSEEGEFIELFNEGDTDEDISWWGLRDGSGAVYTFPSGTSIAKNGFLVVTKSQFEFSLNNSDETVELLDPQGNIVDAMEYKTSKEGGSWNFDGSRWRAGLALTPGAPNNLNGEPGIQKDDVPKKVYKNTYAYFSARASDADGDEVKYRWDFGDGHKSYMRETKHKYKEEGEYAVVLRVDDGREPVEKAYNLKVEKYPKRKLRIIAFEPNPEGKDSDGEWVRVQNQDKKTVDILGWSIATGKDTKHLTNHPIAESAKVKKGKEITVTREMAKITLNNKKGMIALRSPDGKTVQTVKYKKEEGAQEGDVYVKEKGKSWAWQEVVVPENEAQGEEEDNVLLEEVPEIWVDPVSEEMIGMTSGKALSFLDEEHFQKGRQLARVLGAHSVRLRVDGNRYVFTTARSSEHWAVVSWRQVKGMMREVF